MANVTTSTVTIDGTHNSYLMFMDCGFVLLSTLTCRDAVTQIAELLETIGASEHSELVIREHTLKVNQ